MTDSNPLSGKLALVTGASRGIGAATAEALAAAGAEPILTLSHAKGQDLRCSRGCRSLRDDPGATGDPSLTLRMKR